MRRAIVLDGHEYYHLPSGDYSVVITALDDGEIDFDIVVNNNGEATYVYYRDKSVTYSTKAYSEVTREEKFELRIDENGDGSIDGIFTPDEVTEFKDKKELYSYLPYIFFFLAILFIVFMIYRVRTGRIERQVEFETELARKLQTKLINGRLTRKEYEQKLKDIGLDRRAVQTEEHEESKIHSTAEIVRKLDEKIERGEISKETHLQKMEDLGIGPVDGVQKRRNCLAFGSSPLT